MGTGEKKLLTKQGVPGCCWMWPIGYIGEESDTVLPKWSTHCVTFLPYLASTLAIQPVPVRPRRKYSPKFTYCAILEFSKPSYSCSHYLYLLLPKYHLLFPMTNSESSQNSAHIICLYMLGVGWLQPLHNGWNYIWSSCVITRLRCRVARLATLLSVSSYWYQSTESSLCHDCGMRLANLDAEGN